MNRIFFIILIFIPIISSYVGQCNKDSDCPYDQACNAQICMDACRNSCGVNAGCIPMAHGAFCTCDDGFTGDPFKICYEIPDEDPYDEFLCGPYSTFVNVTSVDDSYCLCLPTYRGQPPNCTFIDCFSDDDCDWNENCDFNECVDPCEPNPCGSNSQCRSDGHIRARCTCDDGYFPESYVGCRPIKSNDEVLDIEIIKQQLKGAYCGINAYRDENGNCKCTNGYAGDPKIFCTLQDFVLSEQFCTPNPCGPYSICEVALNLTICSCIPGYTNKPPNCSKCNDDSECPNYNFCISGKCMESPCIDFCGYQAGCEILDGKIACFCKEINRYNPFMECPRLVDTDHICANANKPECGIKLANIFKQSIFYEHFDGSGENFME